MIKSRRKRKKNHKIKFGYYKGVSAWGSNGYYKYKPTIKRQIEALNKSDEWRNPTDEEINSIK